MQKLIDTLISILRIESITGNEAALCDFVEHRIRASFERSKVAPEVRRIQNSLVVIGPIKDRPTICMAGHFDTVSGTGTGDLVRRDQDRIIGLGASDMKGGVAVMLEVLIEDVLERSPYNIIQIYYSGEEGPTEGNEIQSVLDQTPELKNVNLAFVLEPTDNTLHLGCMGTLHAVILFKGQRAHSARPWQGENAIYKAIPFLSELRSMQPKSILLSNLEFKEVMSVTAAQSGDNAKNVVPDVFKLNLNARIAPGTTEADIKQQILDLVGDKGHVKFKDFAPSCPIPSNNLYLEKFRKTFKLAEHPKQAYTDVAAFWQHGIPAVNCGPGHTAQAHQVGEYILTNDLIKSYQIFWTFFLGEM